MLTSLREVTEKLIQEYDPDRIILFGSYGTKNETADSDIDLLIIKQTSRRPLDRRIEVERLLCPRSVSLDLSVYTPEEIRWLFSIGSPLIEEVMETGRLLYMRKATRAWVKEAEDELDSALILLEHGKFRAACYHGQQCVEKCLKAFVLEKAQRPPKTHDIVKLLVQVSGLGWSEALDADDAVFLNSVCRGRHPTEAGLLPHGEPSREEAQRAIEVARSALNRFKLVAGMT